MLKYMYRMASERFHCTVAELNERLSVEEMLHWMAYDQLEYEEAEHRRRHAG
jgi:hypothetical protein